MFDHIGLKVKNLPAALSFYRAALAPLGFELCTEDPSYAGIGLAGAPSLWLYSDKKAETAGVHIAFRAEKAFEHRMKTVRAFDTIQAISE